MSDTILFTSKNKDIANQSVDTSLFTGDKNRMTNQMASLARRHHVYLGAFWCVNLGMYIINKFSSVYTEMLFYTGRVFAKERLLLCQFHSKS